MTEQSYVPNVEVVIKSSLPGSHFIGDSQMTGYISVNVSRRDVFNLPRFFAWLETSPDAVRNIREWGISNTTLEQVFLMLCKSSTDVNYVDKSETQDSSLCPMCRLRPKETVMVRNIPGQIILLPEAVCAVCTVTNKSYFVSEEAFKSLQTLPYPSEAFNNEIGHMLASSRDKATLEYLDSMHFATAERLPEPTAALAIEPAMPPIEAGGFLDDSAPAIADADANMNSASGGSTHAAVVEPSRPEESSQISREGTKGNPHALVVSTVQSQIQAVVIKNVRLQSLQRCSNICGILFVGIMFLLLYVFSLLFQGTDSIKQCSGGYVTFGGEGCNADNLINHIFAGEQY